MGLKAIQIEHPSWLKKKSKSRKDLKKERNRKLRRTPKDKVPNTKKYDGSEY
jgi:hypothetical protein